MKKILLLIVVSGMFLSGIVQAKWTMPSWGKSKTVTPQMSTAQPVSYGRVVDKAAGLQSSSQGFLSSATALRKSYEPPKAQLYGQPRQSSVSYSQPQQSGGLLQQSQQLATMGEQLALQKEYDAKFKPFVDTSRLTWGKASTISRAILLSFLLNDALALLMLNNQKISMNLKQTVDSIKSNYYKLNQSQQAKIAAARNYVVAQVEKAQSLPLKLELLNKYYSRVRPTVTDKTYGVLPPLISLQRLQGNFGYYR